MDDAQMVTLVDPATRFEINRAIQQGEAAPNYLDVSEDEYIEEKVTNGVTVGIFGCLVFFAFVVFFITRAVCCLCCGKGCCARNKKPATTKVVALNVLLVAVPILVNFAGGVWLMLSADPVGESLTTFSKDVIEQLDFVIADVNETVAAADSAPDSVDLSALFEAQEDLLAVRADVAEREDDIDHVLKAIRNTIFVLGTASFLVGLWGFVTILARRSPFMTAFMLAAALVGPAMWILGGVGLATREIIDDFCGMMERHVAGELNPWVLEEARCAQLLNASSAVGELQAAVNAQVGDVNTDLESANEQLQNPLLPTLLPGAADIEALPPLCLPFAELPSGQFVPNRNTAPGCVPLRPQRVNASYSEFVCETEIEGDYAITNPDFIACVNASTPLQRADYDRLLEASRDFQVVNETLPEIGLLSRCAFIDRAFVALTADDCADLRDDFTGMLTAAILSAIGISVAALYFCVCFRNIRHRRYRPGGKNDPDVHGKEVSPTAAAAAEPPMRSYADSAHHKDGADL